MATDAQGRLLSDDGSYYWDGTNWQLVDISSSNVGAASSQSPQLTPRTDAQGRLLSDDGSYYWDGTNWQLIAGSPQSMANRTADLDRDYKGWLAEGNLAQAAESLNGFDLDDINNRLASL